MNKRKRNTKIKLLTIGAIITIFFGQNNFAQETKVIKDFELWSGLEVEKKLNRHWELSFKEEVRLRKDASEVNNLFSQLGINYKINNDFSLEGRYRYIRSQNKKQNYEDHSRYSLGIVYKKDIWDLSIKYRLRYQKKVQNMNLFDLNEPSDQRIRNKIQFTYDAPKGFKPFISAELFLLQQINEYPKYDLVRYQAGLNYNAKKIGKFRLAYGIEKELNSEIPFTHYILSINYSYSF